MPLVIEASTFAENVANGDGGAVTVEVEESGCARVLDRGPGVPAELRGRLFERFWRARRK